MDERHFLTRLLLAIAFLVGVTFPVFVSGATASADADSSAGLDHRAAVLRVANRDVVTFRSPVGRMSPQQRRPGMNWAGWLASVAGIRTFLTYLLDRDLEKAREQAPAESSRDIPRYTGSEIPNPVKEKPQHGIRFAHETKVQ